MKSRTELVPGPWEKRLGHSLAWRVARCGRALCGSERWTRILLESAWVVRRLALEESARTCGEEWFGLAYPSLEFLRNHLSPEDRVLDLGCGVGRIARGIAGFCGEVVAVDMDAGLLERAARLSSAENIRWLRADLARGLPREFSGKVFDWVVCSHVLEHLDWAQSSALLRQMTGVGKTLLVELPDFNADPLNELRRRRGLTWVSDADHRQEFTSRMLGDLLAANGWEVASVTSSAGVLLARASVQRKGAG